ncbi:MAG: DNA-formamidopyrimidine glycosylase [Coxiellaceae bacterium]|nr:DNA-formamidopyrimidine glycosylase [Coxiellaceae bacterium]|tara:strand:+ start:12753 stop:13565 length:813 start_codon:yes stop_codon:yes gene_type:complete
MPELPEVEITRRGIEPVINHQTIELVKVHTPKLRWPIPRLNQHLKHQTISSITRRGKYILIQVEKGTLIIHLGMSGCLKLVPKKKPRIKHDHVEIFFESGICLRYNDPRRFGAMLWTTQPAENHIRLIDLGVEPLEENFTGETLHQIIQNRRCSIKTLLMNSHLIVGIGNIYATEALFISKISPIIPAHRLSKKRCEKLVSTIKMVLNHAIHQGGTTLKDFRNSDGKPGYFSQQLLVYGKAGLPCPNCKKTLTLITQQQRSTTYCTHCQR